jgi:CMP-N,N'-diacetyllegionaminic acid synthase
MIKGKRVLVVIPARGGSKGIPKKNIIPVAGKPLISYTTELAMSLKWADGTVVSTDSAEIAEVALGTPGVEIVWRPDKLSGDRIGDRDVLVHALLEVEATRHVRFDVVVMLQPTSPLRTGANVEQCVALLLEKQWRAVWSVSETDPSCHPRKQLTLRDGELDFYEAGGDQVVARQELSQVFHRNGVCYALTRDGLLDATSLWSPGKTSAVVITGQHISIDTVEDLAQVEKIIDQTSI